MSWQGFPRWVIIIAALWVATLETADKVPQLLLTYPRYEAALAEAQAKLVQPEMVKAQLEKAQNEAKTSAAQLVRAQYEAQAAVYQPKSAQMQVALLKWQAYQAAAAGTQAEASNAGLCCTSHYSYLSTGLSNLFFDAKNTPTP